MLGQEQKQQDIDDNISQTSVPEEITPTSKLLDDDPHEPNQLRDPDRTTFSRVLFNVIIGQLIAVGLVSGGIFTKNLQALGVDTPIFQLTVMYTPLSLYLIYHFACKHKYTPIAIWKLLLCSIVDVHATLLIIYAYTLTTLTSVMVIEDFSIPSAVLLSIFVLKIKYDRLHYVAICICLAGISLGFINDFIVVGKEGEDSAKRPLLGDVMSLFGAFLYALENILQEMFIKKKEDVFNFLGFIGGFGVLITGVYAGVAGEYGKLAKISEDDRGRAALNFFGMAAVNFVSYSIIPFFVAKSGATLLNLSNVTTILWSMLFDIMLYGEDFYILNLVAFAVEMTAIIIFSQKEPIRPGDSSDKSIENPPKQSEFSSRTQ